MDRIEKFVRDDLSKEGDLLRRKWNSTSVRVGVVQIMLLLFADDLILCSKTREGLQRLL